MGITKVNRNFEKGLVIIVGNKPDGVLVHVAKVLGKEIQFLDMAHITPYDDLIYLVGHGDCKKKQIDGHSMSTIAEKLVQGGYTGNQLLYLTACDSKIIRNDTSIFTELQKELFSRLSNRPSLNMISDFDGKSIIVENEHGLECWKQRDNKIKETILGIQQKIIMKSYGLYSDVSLFQNEKKLSLVNHFKLWLIKRFGGDVMTVPELFWRGYLFCYGSILGGIILGVLSLIRLAGLVLPEIEYILLVLGSLLFLIDIWLIKTDKKLQNIVSMLTGAFLITGIFYYFLSPYGSVILCASGFLIILFELIIFLVL